MPFKIEQKLVIAVASRALFDLEKENDIYTTKGIDEYRKYQRRNRHKALKPGVAFPFIRRLLNINKVFSEIKPIEVILLSKNDPDTGLRIFESITNHKLNITRAGFLSGKSPFEYIPAFNASLFLSANPRDVKLAIATGHAAGTVLATNAKDTDRKNELRVAFDFDGVIVDDEAEKVYNKTGDINRFQASEKRHASMPHHAGPLRDLFEKLGILQKVEADMEKRDQNYKRHIRISVVTARNAPAHERFVTTLRDWGIMPDETFFLGGIQKKRILEVMKPHIYFDDQMTHLKSAAGEIPSVHIPFGIMNRRRPSSK